MNFNLKKHFKASFLFFNNNFNFFLILRNVNSGQSSNQIIDAQYQIYSNKLSAAQLAAIASAQARDGALIDLQNAAAFLNQYHMNSRRLLSDYDYADDSLGKQESQDELKNKERDTNKFNLTKKGNNNNNSNSSMELVLINGTWHLIDLDICYKMMASEPVNQNTSQYQNYTHLNK